MLQVTFLKSKELNMLDLKTNLLWEGFRRSGGVNLGVEGPAFILEYQV